MSKAYDAEEFKARANIKTRNVWFLLNLLLTAQYCSNVTKGTYESKYIVPFLLLCWLPYVSGSIYIKIKGKNAPFYKLAITIGYGIFYGFIVCTSQTMLSFAYIFPVASMFILFKDRKFMIRCGVFNCIVLILASIYRFAILGMNTTADVDNYMLQISCIILSYVCYVMSINHLNLSDGALTDSIKDDLERVVKTVEQVKDSSNMIVDGITVVRELEEENKQGANFVVSSMKELSQNNAILRDRTDSSTDMTTKINDQVENVASLINDVVKLVSESVEHTDMSTKELSDVVESTNTMARLSGDVDNILHEFQQEFEKVKTETGTIEEINSQTNLLALNASIEAARAGENGRGFAVVAEQIRALADQSRESTEHINNIVNGLIENSDISVETVKKVTDAFEKQDAKIKDTEAIFGTLNSEINRVGDAIGGITGEVDDLEGHKNNIALGVDNLTEFAQQNAQSGKITRDNMKDLESVMDNCKSSTDRIVGVSNELVKEIKSISKTGLKK